MVSCKRDNCYINKNNKSFLSNINNKKGWKPITSANVNPDSGEIDLSDYVTLTALQEALADYDLKVDNQIKGALQIYDTTVEEIGYYIMVVEGKICVYKQDKETIYFETDLMLHDLPEVVQQEVLRGKYIDSELKVYHFLESYSS